MPSSLSAHIRILIGQRMLAEGGISLNSGERGLADFLRKSVLPETLREFSPGVSSLNSIEQMIRSTHRGVVNFW